MRKKDFRKMIADSLLDKGLIDKEDYWFCFFMWGNKSPTKKQRQKFRDINAVAITRQMVQELLNNPTFTN